jgi:hypothetical protein
MRRTRGAADKFGSQGSSYQSRVWSRVLTACVALTAVASTTTMSLADEDGVSFWIPGFFGSLAAVPQQPGFSLTSIYYHDDVSASGDAAVARAIRIGQLPPTTVSVSGNANVNAKVDLGLVLPEYVFATPFLGGQASVYLGAIYGNNNTSLNVNATATIDHFTPFSASIARQQDTMGFGDLIPIFVNRWNAGVNNYLVYLAGDIPVGLYSSSNLANLGIGHGAIDGGVGYTYLDPKAGHEFSVVAGLTGNFENQSTNYTSGIDFHLDWAASQYLSKQVFVGPVGYVYDQITPDSGCRPFLCPFESRVIGVGAQLGYLFPVGNMQGYLNLKGYGEFDHNDRPDGWNLWVTFAVSPAAPSSSASAPPIITKTPRS